MTGKPKSGTLSTKSHADKKKASKYPPKDANVPGKMKELLGLNKMRFVGHANQRLHDREVLDYEVRQALHSGWHDHKRDRFSQQHQSWEYSIEGKTNDNRKLRMV